MEKNLAKLTKIKILTTGLGILVGLLVVSGSALAATRNPVFQVNGGDIFAGGWVNDKQIACSVADANFQAPSYDAGNNFAPLTSQYEGGIFGYNNLSGTPTGGSASSFGAIALGLIQKKADSGYGFATGGGADIRRLTFGNTGDDSKWGGFFAGNNSQVHCLPDYYHTKQSATSNWSGQLGSAASGQYTLNASNPATKLNDDNQSIKINTKITLFVNGNIYIKGNITYANSDTANQVPRFTLVVLGNIFIDPAVTRLDGFYIAQPDTTSQATIDGTGAFWTCHDNNLSVPDPSYLYNKCDKQLVINGAVAAKQVVLDRATGNVGGAPAEIINYDPKTTIGGPFFNPTVNSNFQIDSMTSMPPIF